MAVALDICQIREELQDAFQHACKNGDVDFARQLLVDISGDFAIDVNEGDGRAFLWACTHGHLNVVRMLLQLTGHQFLSPYSIHAEQELAFRRACRRGHVEVVQELLQLKEPRAINVHARQEDAIRGACQMGHARVVEMLLERGVDVHVHNEEAFHLACTNERVDVVALLLSLPTKHAVNVHAGVKHVFVKVCEKYVSIMTSDAGKHRLGTVVDMLLCLEGDRAMAWEMVAAVLVSTWDIQSRLVFALLPWLAAHAPSHVAYKTLVHTLETMYGMEAELEACYAFCDAKWTKRSPMLAFRQASIRLRRAKRGQRDAHTNEGLYM